MGRACAAMERRAPSLPGLLLLLGVLDPASAQQIDCISNWNGSGNPFTDHECAHAESGGFHLALLSPVPAGACAGGVCKADECCHDANGEHHKHLSIAATGLCFAFVIAVCLSDMVEKADLSDFVPSSSVMIVIGVGLGLLGLTDHGIREFMEFDPEIFGFFLLPIIIFSSAYNLGQGAMQVFFVQVGRISFFAVCGTLMAIGFTGTVILVIDSSVGGFISSGEMKTNEVFMFASLISAVDPVATLGAFAALGIEPKLNALVYGESILNDAVAIAAYRVFEKMESEGFNPASASVSVLWLMVGSLACGVGSGVMASLVFKHFGRKSKCFGAKHDAGAESEHEGSEHQGTEHGADLEHAMVEAASFFFCSMASFFIAEIFHLSGIISALFAGMVCNHYAWFNLTPLAQSLSRHFYEQLMCIMEQLVCIW